MKRWSVVVAAGLVGGEIVGGGATEEARGEDGRPFVSIPDTVSPEARAFLKTMTDPALLPAWPEAGDVAGWKNMYEAREATARPLVEAAIKKYEPTIKERTLGGVPVIEVRPKGWKDNGKQLVYTHGGAYTFFSARSSLTRAILGAETTGWRVISIDYTVAPKGKWQQVTDEVVAVFEALAKEGVPARKTVIYGDSAGGGLAAGAVLKMRDKGMEMPAAVVLWSPWADITNSGDTADTLRHAEPRYLYDKHLGKAADAYADRKEQRNPYVSPVYGDFSKGFPPTLIQGGTKEIFLSHFLRLYQAIDSAGGEVKLDIYDGMTHVFMAGDAEMPESKAALARLRMFVERHAKN